MKAHLAFCVEIERKVAHQQILHAPIEGRTPGKKRGVALSDRSPLSTFFEEGHRMIVIPMGSEMKELRFMPDLFKQKRAQEGTLKTMSRPFLPYPGCGLAVVVRIVGK
jgi:hypothetical protein